MNKLIKDLNIDETIKYELEIIDLFSKRMSTESEHRSVLEGKGLNKLSLRFNSLHRLEIEKKQYGKSLYYLKASVICRFQNYIDYNNGNSVVEEFLMTSNIFDLLFSLLLNENYFTNTLVNIYTTDYHEISNSFKGETWIANIIKNLLTGDTERAKEFINQNIKIDKSDVSTVELLLAIAGNDEDSFEVCLKGQPKQFERMITGQRMKNLPEAIYDIRTTSLIKLASHVWQKPLSYDLDYVPKELLSNDIKAEKVSLPFKVDPIFDI